MAAPPIQGAKQVKDWLEWRNPRDALIIGARVALRVLPLVARAAPIVEHQQAKRRFAALALATFRATALARAAGKYRSRAFRTSLFADAASAADNAGAAFAAADANGAPFVAAAASAVRAAVAHPAASAADAAAAAAAAVVADASAVWASVADDIAVLQSMGTAPLAPSPLWAALLPPLWATDAWASLRAALPADQNWTFWIDWYESILLGAEPWPALDPKVREDLEVAIVSLPNDVWKQGPASANAAIDALIKAAHTPAIAAQGPGPRYGLGDSATIVPVEHWEYDGEGNIPKRIESLLPLTRRAARDLSASLPPNDPYKLSRDARDYLAAIDRDVRQMDWAAVYGFGVFVENAAAEAEREIEDRLVPPLEGPAKKALDSLRTLNSYLIMASGEGRALQEEADALRLTREQHQALREDAQTIAASLDEASDVATPAAAATVVRAAHQMGQGPHPERGSEFGLAAIGNVSVVLVSAATLASFVPIGLAVGGVDGAVMGSGVAWTGYESLKKSAMYANATAALGRKYDELAKIGAGALFTQLVALAPFRRFVRDNEAPLRRIAENTTRLRWMLRYIDFIMKPEGERGD